MPHDLFFKFSDYPLFIKSNVFHHKIIFEDYSDFDLDEDFD